MKIKLIIASLITSVFSFNAFAIDVQLSEAKWDGKSIPEGQQCQKFGGVKPSTPKLLVTRIPEGTDALLIEYSDRDYKSMNNGGHGKMRFALNSSANRVSVPRVMGHSFELPDNFTMISPHLSPIWDKEGAYMPPCSGGRDHAYYVTIKAMKGDKQVESTVLELGRY
jgi:hypothetical protein